MRSPPALLQNAACREIILPDTLRRIEPGAFTGCAVESLTLFDNLQTVSDYAFEGCTALRTLHINAATAPVYSGSYYATFADKYDRLLSLSKTRKLVLFSGSSARFATTARLWIKPCPAMRWSTWGFLPIPTHCPSWN